MVYEFFYLHDEIDWLPVKLREMEGVVDKVIIIECPYDLKHRKKPLVYEENKAKFAKYADKIIHVIAEDKIVENVNMLRTRAANCIQGFKDCKPDDIIIYSDPDVVFKRSTYEQILRTNMEQSETMLVCDWYEYYMDYYMTVAKFFCCSALLYKNTVDSEWSTVDRHKPVGTVINDAGWHFCKMGGVQKIIEHSDGYPHGNLDFRNFMEEEEIEKMIRHRMENSFSWEGSFPNQKILECRPYNPTNYPMYVNEHPEIFAPWFKGGMNA
jgi:hypothetical protein